MLLSEDTPKPITPRPRDLTVDAVITLVAETWPACFSVWERRRRPLKLGIHTNILAVLDGAVTPRELSRALRRYVSNTYYLRMMTVGAVRIDLDGNPAGIVTDEEAATAAVRLTSYTANRKRRAAAATPAPPAPETVPVLQMPDPTPATPKRISLADLQEAARLRGMQEAAQ